MRPGGWALAGEKLAGHPEQTRMPAALLLMPPAGRTYQDPADKGRVELAEFQQVPAKRSVGQQLRYNSLRTSLHSALS